MSYVPVKQRGLKVQDGRVMDVPPRLRTLKVGTETGTKTITRKICYHGKLLNHPCGLCDYESLLLP